MIKRMIKRIPQGIGCQGKQLVPTTASPIWGVATAGARGDHAVGPFI
jgi:hypothetical protein